MNTKKLNGTNINPNEVESQSQAKQIKKYLLQGGKLTFLDALKMFNCARLQARICDLRKQGMDIVTEMIVLPNGKRVAEYSLKK